jgi:hypothetical protein
MTENLYVLLWGTLSLATGTVLLQNLDGIARVDQLTGAKMNDWFQRVDGELFLSGIRLPVVDRANLSSSVKPG